MSKNIYSIDIKIYEPAFAAECPFSLPNECYSETGNALKPGYYTIQLFGSPEELEKFESWARKNTFILKVIGTVPIAE